MEYFEFVEVDKLEYRSKFANRIFKLLYEKHNGDLDKASTDGEPFYEGMEELIRNFYELVENEMPLYALWYLRKHGADNYDFTEEEYKQAEQNCIDACHKYYK